MASDTVPETDGLTPRQRLFVAEYLMDLNAAQAAVRAGYRKGSSSSILKSAAVRQAIKGALAARIERIRIDADRVLQEFAAMGLVNMADIAEWEGGVLRLKDSKELTRQQAAAVIELSQGKEGLKVKLDKLGALNSAARHLGMFIGRQEITGKDGGPIETKAVAIYELPSNGRD